MSLIELARVIKWAFGIIFGAMLIFLSVIFEADSTLDKWLIFGAWVIFLIASGYVEFKDIKKARTEH